MDAPCSAEVPIITDADRAAIDVMLKGFDAARAAIEEQMAPLLRVVDIITDGRETLLEHYGIQPTGRCERCEKLLFVGEPGAKPFADSNEVVYCAEHAPTLGDLMDTWDRHETEGESTEETELREAFNESLKTHLTKGGSLNHKAIEILS